MHDASAVTSARRKSAPGGFAAASKSSVLSVARRTPSTRRAGDATAPLFYITLNIDEESSSTAASESFNPMPGLLFFLLVS
jgi:hypothetical protein